jgi:uncharacterized protein YlxW (UPF0749 family)
VKVLQGLVLKEEVSQELALLAEVDGWLDFFDGGVEATGFLTVQGTNIGGLAGRLQAVEVLMGRVQALENREQGIEPRLNTLQQQVNSLQQQLASLQQKQAEDVQGIVFSLAMLAVYVAVLGG